MYAHIKTCKEEKLDKIIDEQDFLNEQMRRSIDTEKNSKKCKYCGKIFNYLNQYTQHLVLCEIYFKYIQNVSNGYNCLICRDQFFKNKTDCASALDAIACPPGPLAARGWTATRYK